MAMFLDKYLLKFQFGFTEHNIAYLYLITKCYTSGNKMDFVIQSLQPLAGMLFSWFSENQLENNTDKCYLILKPLFCWNINRQLICHKKPLWKTLGVKNECNNEGTH